MRLIIIGYYYLIEGFLGGATALKKIGFDVDFFPWLFYKNTKKELLKEHLISFINGEDKQYENVIINNNFKKADVLLWWNTEIQLDLIEEVGKCNVMNILYSWYDPISYFVKNENREIIKQFDIIYSSCLDSVNYYKENGCKSFHIYTGFDENIHHYVGNDEYKCDISFVIHNLYNYETPYNKINREELINKLINETDYNIKIYGQECLGKLFPNNYVKNLNFNETKNVFSNSKININTHITMDGHKYLNERTFQILGCKGLLLIDNIKGIDSIFNNECIVIDEDNIIEQINEIIANYDKYTKIKENGFNKVVKMFKWDNWASQIKKDIITFMKKETKKQKKIVVKEGDFAHSKLIPIERVEYELIFLLKTLNKTSIPLYFFLKDIYDITEKSQIDINDVLNKFYNEIGDLII